MLKEIEAKRLQILQAGYKLDEIVTLRDGPDGIEFKIKVSNGTDGHNVPTGFDAERLVWLRVTVRDADGKAIFKSGDYDPNGDVRAKAVLESLGAKIENTYTRVGNPIDEIIDVGRNYSLIAVSASSKSGIQRFFMGSVSFQVLEHAENSVMIVR